MHGTRSVELGGCEDTHLSNLGGVTAILPDLIKHFGVIKSA